MAVLPWKWKRTWTASGLGLGAIASAYEGSRESPPAIPDLQKQPTARHHRAGAAGQPARGSCPGPVPRAARMKAAPSAGVGARCGRAGSSPRVKQRLGPPARASAQWNRARDRRRPPPRGGSRSASASASTRSSFFTPGRLRISPPQRCPARAEVGDLAAQLAGGAAAMIEAWSGPLAENIPSRVWNPFNLMRCRPPVRQVRPCRERGQLAMRSTGSPTGPPVRRSFSAVGSRRSSGRPRSRSSRPVRPLPPPARSAPAPPRANGAGDEAVQA